MRFSNRFVAGAIIALAPVEAPLSNAASGTQVQGALEFPKPVSGKVSGTHRYEYSSASNQTTASLEIPFAVVYGRPYVSTMRAWYRHSGQVATAAPDTIIVELTVPLGKTSAPAGQSPAIALVVDDSARVAIPVVRGTPSGDQVIYTARFPIRRFLDLANASRATGEVDGAAWIVSRPILLAIRQFASHMNPAAPPPR